MPKIDIAEDSFAFRDLTSFAEEVHTTAILTECVKDARAKRL
jgi:hypothetical protein